MGPNFQQERRDWHQVATIPPRILSYDGYCKQPQYQHLYHADNHYIFDSRNLASQRNPHFSCENGFTGVGSNGVYPHSTYYGSTTMATMMGRQWSLQHMQQQQQQQQQQQHCSTNKSISGSTIDRNYSNCFFGAYYDNDDLVFGDRHNKNNYQPKDDADDIVEAILDNPIFRVDGILDSSDPTFDGKDCFAARTECGDALNRLPNLEGETETAVAVGNGIPLLNNHTSTGSQYHKKNNEAAEAFVDGMLDLEDLSHKGKNREIPHVKTGLPSSPPGKVYRVLRRPLKEDSQRKYEPEVQFLRAEQDFLVLTNSKITQDLPTEKISADIQRIPSTSKSNVDVTISKKRTIFTYKTWDTSRNQWRRNKIYKARGFDEIESAATPYHYHIPLTRGGELNVFPNLIDSKRVNRVKKEVLESKFWRKYSIQGGDEPRLHFLVRVF